MVQHVSTGQVLDMVLMNFKSFKRDYTEEFSLRFSPNGKLQNIVFVGDCATCWRAVANLEHLIKNKENNALYKML